MVGPPEALVRGKEKENIVEVQFTGDGERGECLP